MHARQLAALQAEEIIETQVEHFLGWLRSQGAQTTIKDYRLQAYTLREQVLRKSLAQLDKGLAPEAVLTHLAHQLTNKLLHTPSVQIREAGINERPDLIAAARELFKL
jgi:glutamyl-tRNA reductase